MQDYVKANKNAPGREIEYLNNVKNYIGKIKTYSDQVVTDLDKNVKDLSAMENYFRSAKVGPQTGGTDIAAAPEEAAVCANASAKGA